jgi:transcriptional regulator with XRE-family HTH domain
MQDYPYGILVAMDGEELRKLRGRQTQVAFAGQLGVHSNTLARYERDELPIPEPVARLAQLLSKAKPKRRS